MNYSNVVAAIHKMSSEDLNGLVDAIKLRRTRLARESAGSLCVGDLVSFQGRAGHVQGVVQKINRKTVVVDAAGQGRWKVTASMLTPA